MKKLIYLLSITFLMLQSCSSGDKNSDSSTDNKSNNVDYKFTYIIDGNVYKVSGNTANDFGNNGPKSNLCTAYNAKQIVLSITDPTYSNFVSGSSFNIILNVPDNFGLGINKMSTNKNFYKQNACPGCSGSDTSIQVEITDLGTPSIGDLGTPNFKYGNTIKGHYSGVYYSIPSGSNNATIPHTVSIDFEAVRLY